MNEIEIVVKSTDRTGPGFDSAGRRTSALGGIIGSFAKTAAFGLAGVGVAAVGMGVSFVKSAEESQRVTKQTEAVLKSMGGAANVTAQDVAGLSEALSKKTGIDDEVIQSGENVLLTFGNIRNEVGEGKDVFDRATAAALDMSVAMGTDMQSAVMQVGKALNDPIAGLTALTRVGVQFTDQQKDQIEAMVAAGDTMGAQQIILAELERQFTGSAEAQATASDKLGVAWDNLGEALGEKLLGPFTAFADWLLVSGIPAIERIADAVEAKVVPALRELVAWFEAKVLPKMVELWEFIEGEMIPAWQGIVEQIRGGFLPALGEAMGAVGELIAVFTGADDKAAGTRDAVGWVTTALTYLTAGVQTVIGQFTWFAGVAASLIGALRVVAESVWAVTKAIYGGVLSALGSIADAIRTVWSWAERAASAVGGLQAKLKSLPSTGGLGGFLGGFSGFGALLKASGGVVGAQSGGLRSGLTMVGEHGRELVDIPPGSRVHGNAMTEGMLAAGGRQAPIVLQVSSGGRGEFEEMFAEMIRRYVRVNGGGDVQAVLGFSR